MKEVKYTKEFQVHYYEIDKYQMATPITIINYLEETAIAHSESVGYGVSKLLQDGAGWVLNRWHITMERYPSWNEKVVVETWPSSFERFHATREFYIKDSKGIIIGKATSIWIYFNINKRRPARIPAEISEAYGIASARAIEKDFKELTNVEEIEFQKDFYVRRSDIDTNNHVNNTRYVEWALEAIPQEVYDEYMLSTIDVVYKKETNYGAAIYSNCKAVKRDALSCEFAHSILSKDDSTVVCLISTEWKRREG